MAATVKLVTLLIFLPILLSFGQTPTESRLVSENTETLAIPAAVVNGEIITTAELESEIRSAKRQLEDQLRKLREAALSKLIDNRLLEQESARRSQTVEEILRTQVEDVTVSEDEVRASMGLSNDWPPGTLRAEAAYRTKRQLEDSKRSQAYRQLLEKLHASAQIVNRLQATREDLTAGNPTVLGRAMAPATLVVFTDYACKFCQSAENEITLALRRYPERLRVVVRHFPLARHAGADTAARIAFCAHDQGRFAEAHSILYKSNPGEYATLPMLLGLDRVLFDACMSSQHTSARLQADLDLARRVEVGATPTLYLDNQRLSSVKDLIPRLERLYGRADESPLGRKDSASTK